MTEDNGGFSLNGIPASEYGATLLYSPGQPMLPESRDRTSTVLRRAGQYWIGSELGTREFDLPCQFRDCEDAAALDTLIRAFARVFVDASGRPKQLKLILDDAPDVYYLVRYAGQVPFDRAWVGCSDFSLSLIADDPYAYQLSEEFDIQTITTSGESMEIISDGSVSTPAIICVENTGIAEITNGFSLKIQYEVD